MTGLERRLTAALERLPAQFEMERRRQSERIAALRKARRNVARPLDLTRRRGLERDQGPSR